MPDACRAPKRRDAPDVVRQAILLLVVLGWLRPGERRTGSARQEHRLAASVLGRRLDVSAREVTRYYAVLEHAGILRVWQPPQASGAPHGPSGYCYALFELQGDLPAELADVLARWHGTHRTRERLQATQAPTARAAAPELGGADAALQWVRGLAHAPPS